MSTPIDNEKNAPSGERSKLPAIPAINNGSLENAVAKLKEIVEIREGRRGSKYEQAVTWRDLWEVGLVAFDRGGNWIFNQADGAVQGTTLINQSSAMRSTLEEEIRNSRAFKELFSRINSPESLAGFPDEVRAALERDIADIAKEYGAAIRQIDTVIQNMNRSFAMRLTEITAATESAQAGVRHLVFASATRDKAQAGDITQVRARLDNFGGTGVTVEQKMVATVDRVNGLSGTYTVKIDANGKFAGFVLAVDAPVGQPAISQFLINADQLAFFSNNGKVSPFGADANGVYMNGQVRINSGGGLSLEEFANNAATPAVNFIGAFATEPAGKKNNVYKNTASGISYIHNGTSWVTYMEPGTRGSVTLYASGSAWSDSIAVSTIAAATKSNALVIGDTVTISSAAGAYTKYWSGTAWVDPGVVINGNLLVNGSLSATKLSAGSIAIPSANSVVSLGPGGSSFPFNDTGWNVIRTGGVGPAAAILNYGAAEGLYISSTGGGGSVGIRASSVNGNAGALQSYSSFYAGLEVKNLYGGHAIRAYGGLTGSPVGSAIIGLSDGRCFYNEAGTFGPFTGAHDAIIAKDQDTGMVAGDIIVDEQLAERNGVSDTIFCVRLSDKPRQKTVIGVLNTRSKGFSITPAAFIDKDSYGSDADGNPVAPGAKESFAAYLLGYDLLTVNALGEGQINVCGENGDLEAGDLIVTSSMRGKGMRQDDDLVRSMTVARAREGVRFSSPGEVRMVACVYLCG